MKPRLMNSPANRAYDVFKATFQSEEDLAAWMWKYKDRIVPDCIYEDGSDGQEREYIDIIEIQDPESRQIAVLDGMPSRVEVRGIGTTKQTARFTWADGSTVVRESVEESFPATLADYQAWAKANGVQTTMPIMKLRSRR